MSLKGKFFLNSNKRSTFWFSFCLCLRAKLLPLCLTLCESRDSSWPGSSVHEILEARILEWAAVSSSRASSQTGIEPVSLRSPALETCTGKCVLYLLRYTNLNGKCIIIHMILLLSHFWDFLEVPTDGKSWFAIKCKHSSAVLWNILDTQSSSERIPFSKFFISFVTLNWNVPSVLKELCRSLLL